MRDGALGERQAAVMQIPTDDVREAMTVRYPGE
jgi:hypothetical protein